MQVIWAQVITHIIGFVIAVLILKRFAWGPILQLLEERRAKIQGEFDRVESSRREVISLREQVEAQLRDMEAQRRARIQDGVNEGRRVGNEIEEQARQERVALMQRTQDDIGREWDKAHVALRNDMASMVIRATEQLLREEVDDERHRRLVADYLKEIEAAAPEHLR